MARNRSLRRPGRIVQSSNHLHHQVRASGGGQFEGTRRTNPTSRLSALPFSRLLFPFAEIGRHRGREHGLGAVFKFRTLRDVSFLNLANKVKNAYEQRDVPSHKGWEQQIEQIRWFVSQGKEGLYALDGEAITVRPGRGDRYYLLDGTHRCLALYILGDAEIRDARVKPGYFLT